MNRPLTALLSALEAVLVVAIGVAIPLAPLTVLWATHFGFALDWAVFWRAAVDIWLIGHGVDVTLTLDPATAAALAVPGAEAPIPITIAALGFALLTALLGVRAGRRIAETSHRLTGEACAVGAFALLSLGVAATAVHPAATPSLGQSVLLPPLAFGLGVLVGSASARSRNPADTHGGRLRERLARWRPASTAAVAAALRGGAAAAAAVLAVSAVALAVLLLTRYAEIIRLYEALHPDIAGGVALTLGELALVPNAVAWTASWFTGPGFAIGTGSSVSPLGTAVGPLPAVPLLGAVPAETGDFAFAGVLVPVVAGFLAAAVVARRLDADWRVRAAVAAAIGAVGGLLLGLAAWASAGSAGPGRLVDVGPDPLLVGAFAALELGLGAAAGVAVATRAGEAGAALRARLPRRSAESARPSVEHADR